MTRISHKEIGTHAGLWLFLTSFIAYMIVSPGNLPGDTEIRWSVARELIRHQSIALEGNISSINIACGVDGRSYSIYGIGQSLLLVPFAAIGLIAEQCHIIGSDKAELLAQMIASLILFPACGALTVWLLYQLGLIMGYSQQAALITTIVFAFCTMHFHYSINTHEETQVAALILTSLYCLIKYQRTQQGLFLWLLCFALGGCILFRMTAVVLALPLFIIACLADWHNHQYKHRILFYWLLPGIFGTGLFIAVLCGYNFARFGHIYDSGYHTCRAWSQHPLFGSSPIPTIAAMLFSPGKSILLYNPVLILGIILLTSFWKKHKVISAITIVSSLSCLLFHSFYSAWAGDYAWGVRYLVSILPLWMLPMMELFGHALSNAKKRCVQSIIAISFLIQAASVTYNFNLEFVQNGNHAVIPDNYVWDCRQSHLYQRIKNISQHVIQKHTSTSVRVHNEDPTILKINHSLSSVQKAYYLNFFPFKAKANIASKTMVTALFGFWLLLWLGLILTSIKLCRCLSPKSTPDVTI